MTPRALPRSRLANLIPALLDSKALVAVVPGPLDDAWAARAAWDVARAAARTGRRVALVDLRLEQPSLHEVVGLTPSEGIVEVFEQDFSLTKAAREVDGVFFIGAGARTEQPSALFGHQRWQKLQRGFQSEGALLLLFLSLGDLPRLAAIPDGLLVLSPEGLVQGPEGIDAAMERGTPLLGVVRERWTPAPGRVMTDQVVVPNRRRRSAVRLLAVTALLLAGAAGVWQLLAKDADRNRATSIPAVHVDPQPPVEAPPLRIDTVSWTIQVAAFGTLRAALDLSDRLSAGGPTTFVTPVASGRGTIWYRVLAGFYRTREAAVAARDTLWQQGAVTRGEGDPLLAPYSLALEPTTDVAALRAIGVPAVRLPLDGRTLVGAFESPEQATLAETRLHRAGVQSTLVTRTETTQ